MVDFSAGDAIMKYEVVKCGNDIYYIVDNDTGVVVRTTDKAATATLICEQLNTNNILPEEA